MAPLHPFGGADRDMDRAPAWERREVSFRDERAWAALASEDRRAMDDALRRGERVPGSEALAVWRARHLTLEHRDVRRWIIVVLWVLPLILFVARPYHPWWNFAALSVSWAAISAVVRLESQALRRAVRANEVGDGP